MDIWIDEYESGLSIPKIADAHGAPRSRVRVFLLRNGVALRDRVEAVRASVDGRKPPPAHRAFTEAHKQAIASARKKWGEENATCLSKKPTGYEEYTVGEKKGKSFHVVTIEDRIGRVLLDDEVVHHIDGDRSNNSLDNLALMTRNAHSRLHRFEDHISGKSRERTTDGRFC